MFMKITEKAYAKINLTLDVLSKRPDGYHNLRMVMQSLSLHDTIILQRTGQPGIRLTSDCTKLSLGKNNLIVRAAAELYLLIS
jgi:4-diphosphocytidyl-2-C-methyl-D-erythritol kinase